MTPEDTVLARNLVDSAATAALSTLTRGEDRIPYPFGSLVATTTDELGRPLLLLSALAEHTKNITACPRASLLYAHLASPEALAEPRVTLLGRIEPVSADLLAPVRDRYLSRHPAASAWASFGDFGFYRLAIDEVRLVLRFGKMGWIDPVRYSHP